MLRSHHHLRGFVKLVSWDVYCVNGCGSFRLGDVGVGFWRKLWLQVWYLVCSYVGGWFLWVWLFWHLLLILRNYAQFWEHVNQTKGNGLFLPRPCQLCTNYSFCLVYYETLTATHICWQLLTASYSLTIQSFRTAYSEIPTADDGTLPLSTP